MTFANRNQLWGTVVAQELARSGVREVCLSPGSRSTPLALALHAETQLRVTTHLDERSAAYFALGVAQATQRPAVLVCTSGTAAANYLPAIVEAHQARVPLIVLTADRPPELHDVGANQSIDQQHLYGRFVRWFADAGLPQPTPQRVRHLRALVCRAVARARGAPGGPVHLNFPFQEPLEPTPVPGDVPEDWHHGDLEAANGRKDGAPFVTVQPARPAPDLDLVDDVASRISTRPSGLIIAGPRRAEESYRVALVELSRVTGYPILADPLSGLRFIDDDTISTYDAFLADPTRRQALRPDVVLRFGAMPTSKNLLTFLKLHADALQVVSDESGTGGEETGNAHVIVPGDASLFAQALAATVRPTNKPSWRTEIHQLETTTRTYLDSNVGKRPFEGAIIHRVLKELPDDAIVFVSNSLPVRDLDRFAPRRGRLLVYGNRGASGIDGIVSTACGIAHAQREKVLLVTGDLAFLHDLSALVTRRRLDLPLDILVLNNDGGGIFEFLPISQHEPPFTELFVTPHGLDLAAIGNSLGLATRTLSAADALTSDLKLGRPNEPATLLEVRTERAANVQHRRELDQGLRNSLATPEAPRRGS